MYRNALDLMSQVPVDMSRIEELMYAERNNLIDSFHRDARPGGELIAEYLDRSDALFSGTDSGQVYNGAIKMLSNHRLNSQITSRVRMICRSEAMEALPEGERMALERAWHHMVGGMEGVLKLRRSCSETVANAITQCDHEIYREYTTQLKELYRVVLDRGLIYRPAGHSLMADPLDTAEVETLMYKLSTRPAKTPPPPLHEADPSSLPVIDLARLRHFGGARTAEVLDALAVVVAERGPLPLAEAFSALDTDLRRSVEVSGLMRFALLTGVDVEHAPRGIYHCVGLEGEESLWSAPDMLLVAGLIEEKKGEFDV